MSASGLNRVWRGQSVTPGAGREGEAKEEQELSAALAAERTEASLAAGMEKSIS